MTLKTNQSDIGTTKIYDRIPNLNNQDYLDLYAIVYHFLTIEYDDTRLRITIV